MRKHLGKRLISLALTVAVLVTTVPLETFAEGVDSSKYTGTSTQQTGTESIETGRQSADLGKQSGDLQSTQSANQFVQAENSVQENTLDYALNGGAFSAGYEAPSSYPVTELPDGEVLERPGYSFAGWYENTECTGDAVTEVRDADHTGPVILYAKWTDAYYYVDIPTGVDIPADTEAGTSEVKIYGKSEGLYADDRVSVSVNSENDWKLVSGNAALPYELREETGNTILEDDVIVMNLSDKQKSDERVYTCAVTKEPEVTGDYSDKLDFTISFASKNYTITYEANGGFLEDPANPGELILFTPETYTPGKELNDLPVAIRSGYTFLGWCYDEACTNYVDVTDRLLGDITLYASYTENQQLESHTIATFARAIDVPAKDENGKPFTIQVTDQSATLTAAQIKDACKLVNLSEFNENIVLSIASAGSSIYTVSAQDGWKEGASYKLTLENENLYFTGFDPTIREYEIVIHKDEVKNVELNLGIRYINVKNLTNLTVNGKQVQSVSIATMTVGMDGSVQSEGSSTTGSFTYTDGTLKIGDQIAVYSGDVIPGLDDVTSFADGENDLSFFEITGVNGTTYSYRGAATEDVLFMPEVLPLERTKDLDGDPDNNSVTVNISDLTFGEDEISRTPEENAMIRELGLDAETTVDAGDFLALYTDINNGDIAYAKILNVESEDGKYIITYEPQTWEQVQEAMDVYATEPVDGETLLKDTDTQALQSSIETQAVESGFAEEVADQIAELAMRTESYEELQKTLGEELGADVAITQRNDTAGFRSAAAADSNTAVSESIFAMDNYAALGITTPASQAATGGKTVTVGKPSVKADIDTKLRHFDGNLSGVHLGLEVAVPITFHVSKGVDFNITVTATFEQEVRVSINVDGEAVWKVWGIFPYIADYRVTASLDLYEYTGISLDVNFKVESASDDDGSEATKLKLSKKQKLAKNVADITIELKDMMEKGREIISDKSALIKGLTSQEDESQQNEISVAKSLAERYAGLLEDESDWVEIYSRDIVKKHIRVILIIDIEIKLEFVVSTNVNISMGMSFWYKNAKRYVFSLHVKGRKATSDTIDLVEEQYEFSAYAMGTIGLKAGVRLTIGVGLLSTELASVGLSADVGGYVQLWGYLYYLLQYTASAGRNTTAMGALYLEIGIYLEIKFRAQAFANSFTYAPTLYEAMWPVYTIGSVENVIDFADKETLEYNLKYEMRTVRLPDDFFSMSYLDLKEGLDGEDYFQKIYEDDSDQYFTITMTNDAFTYDPKTDIITVNPGSEKSVDGEMIVTWKNQPGTFNTKPYQKKVKLHWDMLRDGYFIVFVSNGGSYVNMISEKYGTDIKAPTAPEKQGYTFAGWYQDEALTIPYTIPATMPDRDTIAYAKWDPAQVSYTVKTYIEGTNGIYEPAENGVTKEKALTGTEISPVPSDKEGFETPTQRIVTVKADGSTLVEYYYARNEYTITYKSDDETISTGSYRYGTMMPEPAVYKPGYQFAGWVEEGGTNVTQIPETVPAEDKTYFAKWDALTDIGYSVRYYVQNETGNGYSLNAVQYLTGTTGATVTAPAGNYDTAAFQLKDPNGLPSGVIKADGSLELRVYYDRKTYTVTYNLMAQDAALPEGSEQTFTARPEEKLVTAVPERSGYEFVGWYTDDTCQTEFDNTMPASDITLYAKWERVKVNYTVRYYLENLPILNEYGQEEWGDGPTTDAGSDGAAEGGSVAGSESSSRKREYTLAEEELFTAPAGEEVSPDVKTYEGFTSPDVKTEVVTTDENGQGNLVIEYRYERKKYSLKWYVEDNPEGNDSEVYYGATIQKPDAKEAGKDGYHVGRFFKDQDLKTEFTGTTMPAEDLTLYPEWIPEEVEYTVIYHFDGGNREDIEENHTALIDTAIPQPEEKEFEGYTLITKPENLMLDSSGKYFIYDYEVNTYDLICYYATNEDNGEVKQQYTGEREYGQIINVEDPKERDGYAFAGWYTDADYKHPFTEDNMPAHDVTLYGKWEYGRQSYQVLHYLEKLDGSGYTLYQVENLYGTPDEEVTPESKAPEGFADVEPVTHTLVAGSVSDNRIEYRYRRKKYRITYVPNGGTSVSEQENVQELFYDAKIDNDLNRAGYEFVGWYLDEELQNPLTSTKMPAHDLTLYAKWKAIQSCYYIDYYLQYQYPDENGEYPYYLDRREYGYADTGTTVETKARQYTGYTPKQETQSGVVLGNDPTDRSNCLIISYYYDRNSHSLTLHDSVKKDHLDVEDVTMENVTYGTYMPTQFRFGYTFDGWYRDAEYTDKFTGTMPDSDLTLYAKWIAQECSYKIIHKKQDFWGWYNVEETETGKAPTGSFITPTVKSYDGFTSPEVKTEQITANSANYIELLYARNKYTVTFKLENGEQDIVYNKYYGKEVIAPNPKRTGYTFLGWDKKVADTMPAEDITYTAKWQINSYRMTIMSDGKTLFDKTYTYGEKVEIPAETYDEVKKAGYTFIQWSGEIPKTMPDHDVCVSAQWAQDVYKITYDLAGGSEYFNPSSYTYDSKEIILAKPQRTGYEFLGWSGTEIDGMTDTVTIRKHSTGDRSYTANWKEKTYTIEFLPVTGYSWKELQPMTITYFESKKLPKFENKASGYSFAGWTTDSSTGQVNYTDQHTMRGTMGNMTLYPVYRPNKYRVTFQYDSDDLIYTWNTHEYGSSIGIPWNESDGIGHKKGYVIEGWDRSDGSGYYSRESGINSFILRDAKDITLNARWGLNHSYTYEPSNSGNVYNITDGKNREITFTFYTDDRQKEKAVTGDIGLGNGADYVMNMPNIDVGKVRQKYKKMKIEGSYYVEMVQDGYAILRISYMTTDGKEVKNWKTQTSDLLDATKTKKFSYELDRTDIKWIKLEFDADGGGPDQYLMSKLGFTVTYE